MNNNSLLFVMLNENILKEILYFFPFQIIRKIISLCPKKYQHNFYKNFFNIKEDFDICSFINSERILKTINKKDSEQFIYLDKEIFLPIYTVFASGIPFIEKFCPLKENSAININNTFSANDYYFNIKVLNRNMFVLGGIYYDVEPGNYYYFLENFKIPFEKIKTDYINHSMPKLSSIMKKNNLYFTDFEYYIFNRDTGFFDKTNIRKKKLKLTNIEEQYVSFFKRNKSFFYAYYSTWNDYNEHVGMSYRFEESESKVKFVVKRFRFFFLKKNFVFHIYSINTNQVIEVTETPNLEKECLKQPKKLNHTYSKDGVTIQEYYNCEDNEAEPIITVSPTENLDYFEYPLQHYRLGKYILISYQKKQKSDILPKVYSYGALVNISS